MSSISKTIVSTFVQCTYSYSIYLAVNLQNKKTWREGGSISKIRGLLRVEWVEIRLADEEVNDRERNADDSSNDIVENSAAPVWEIETTEWRALRLF